MIPILADCVEGILLQLTSEVSINELLARGRFLSNVVGTKRYTAMLEKFFVRDLAKQNSKTDQIIQREKNITYHSLVWSWRKSKPTNGHVLLVDCHGDVVPPLANQVSVNGMISNGRVYARGSADPYGTLACLLAALRDFDIEESEWDCIVVAIPDGEELGLHGALHVSEWLRTNRIHPTDVVVFEPTSTIPITKHRGRIGITYRFHGVAGHLGDPSPEQCAFRRAHAAARLILNEADRLRPAGTKLTAEVANLAIGVFAAGSGQNTQADQASFSVDRRVGLYENIKDVFDKLAKLPSLCVPEGSYEIETEQISPPLNGTDTSQLAEFLSRISQKPVDTAFYVTDASAYSGNVWSSSPPDIVVWGVGNIEQAHTADEFIDIQSLYDGIPLVTRLLRGQ